MKVSNISYTKNHLSELLARVKEGESILILDRKQPVARLEPAGSSPSDGRPAWMARLIQGGLIHPAPQGLDVEQILRRPLPRAKGVADVVQTLVDDRGDRL